MPHVLGVQSNRGFTGIEVVIVIAIIAIIAAILIPNLLKARILANESAAISSLRLEIQIFQSLYFTNDPDADGPDFGTLAELETHYPIHPDLAAGVKGGYEFFVDADNRRQAWKLGQLQPSRGVDALAQPLDRVDTDLDAAHALEGDLVAVGEQSRERDPAARHRTRKLRESMPSPKR